MLWFGAWLCWLIGRSYTAMPRLLTSKSIERDEPVVETENRIGGVEYSDAFLADNDARFVFNFVRGAMDHGTIAVNYVESLGAERSAGGDGQCRVRDCIGGSETTVTAKVVINACGPYVETRNRLTQSETSHRHVFSRGIYLVVDRITPSRRVLSFFADDGRLFFVIPMGPKSCIGTTDTRQEQLPAEVKEEDQRFVYIRCELHHMARLEMVTKLDDFLRRRSKIALIARRETQREAPGVFEACEILFGDEAEAKFSEYFGPSRAEELRRRPRRTLPQARLQA